jgi:hypothetical protein
LATTNTQFQFGFNPYGSAAGKVPNFGFRRRTIAYNYATALFRGDPVASNNAGNIVAVSSQTAPVAGVFWGCEYQPSGILTQLPIKAKMWPGVALTNTASVVTAFIIDDPDMLYTIAELGSTAALTAANIGNNAQWNAGAGGNTATGISSYVLDDGNITTTVTLPIKIMDLYSTYGTPGTNGTFAALYNWAVVKLNNTDRAAGTVGI